MDLAQLENNLSQTPIRILKMNPILTPPQIQPVHQILITLQNGQLKLAAPPDKILALGMIELAKHIILTTEPPAIQAPSPQLSKKLLGG